MAEYYIYALLCPDTGKVRYVGKTGSLHYRMLSHRNGFGQWPVERWKRRLFEEGKYATFRIIEEVDGRGLAKWREHWWIRFFLHRGQPLFNLSLLSPATARQRSHWKQY